MKIHCILDNNQLTITAIYFLTSNSAQLICILVLIPIHIVLIILALMSKKYISLY